jgi:hypothetical protein
MSCTAWNDSLVGRLYGEIDGDDAAALTAHLASCGDCRETLDEFRRVRTVLRDDEPQVAATPRVVVLRGRTRMGWMALAASLLGAALLAGAGAGAGYALGRGAAAPPAGNAALGSAKPVVDTEDLVRREVDRRLAALTSASGETSSKGGDRAVSSPELKAELAKLEKKMNGMRAADLDFVLDQIGASEFRTGTRIGKTNDALKTVALASNPYANAQ